MKSFNDYSGIEEPQQEDNLLLPEGFVYDQEPLLEGTKSSHADLPAVLVMRRMAVRLFPTGQKIALYKVDKLNKYITIPYTDDQWVMSAEHNK